MPIRLEKPSDENGYEAYQMIYLLGVMKRLEDFGGHCDGQTHLEK